MGIRDVHAPEKLYNLNLTKDQYGRIQDVLKTFQQEHINDSSGHSALVSGTIDFAVTLVCTSSIDFGKLSYECFQNKSDL